MKGIFAVATSLIAMYAAPATSSPDLNCFPIPHAEEIVTLLEPRNAAIYDPRGIWVEFSVTPFSNDIRGFFVLSATANPLDSGPSATAQHLVVDTPYRLSGDTVGSPTSPITGLWLVHLSKPAVASRVSVNYSINLWRTPSGAPCDGPPSVRHVGDFIWVPTNGVGPFGQKPPLP